MANNTDYKKQKLMIENLLSSPDLFAVCVSILDSKYFEPELRNSVKFILDYYNKYSNTPKPQVIEAETGMDYVSRETLSFDEYEYTATNVEQFCKQRAVIHEVLNASKYIESGDFGTLTAKLEEAVLISLQRDLGTNLFAGVAERITQRMDNRKPIPTLWPNVDEILGGGLNETELIMFSANSGGGKSIALSNLSLNFCKQGHDVLYISLELSEDMVADRFETMITGISKLDKFERISETASQVENFHHKSGGSIYIKYMDPESNANDIKAYLKEFQVQYKKLPKLLIVDYLDIFGTNERQQYSNVYEKDKTSSTQLRAIGNNPQFNMVMATASQQNRGAINQTEMNQGHIAGGLSKVNIVDVYASIIMTDPMRAEGIADFQFLKTRSSDGVGKIAHMKWDPVRLMFTSLGSDNAIKQRVQAKKNNSTTERSTNVPQAGESKGDLDLLDLMDM